MNESISKVGIELLGQLKTVLSKIRCWRKRWELRIKAQNWIRREGSGGRTGHNRWVGKFFCNDAFLMLLKYTGQWRPSKQLTPCWSANCTSCTGEMEKGRESCEWQRPQMTKGKRLKLMSLSHLFLCRLDFELFGFTAEDYIWKKFLHRKTSKTTITRNIAKCDLETFRTTIFHKMVHNIS